MKGGPVPRGPEPQGAVPTHTSVLEELLRAAAEAVGATRASLCWREVGAQVRALAVLGVTPEVAQEFARPVLEAGARGVEAYRVEDLCTHERLAGQVECLGCTALLALPLPVAGADGVGVLVVCLAGLSLPRAEVERRLGAYARLAGVALENERLVEAARRATAQARVEAEQAELLRLSSFQSVTEAFGRALGRAEVGETVLARGLPAVGAVSGTVHLVSGGRVERVAAAGLEGKALVRWEAAGGGGPPGLEVLEHGSPLWLESPEEVRARYPELVEGGVGVEYQACACVPLQVEQRTLGVLSFGFAQPRRFTELRRALLRGLARQCAQAFERARLYEDERAARLQAEAARKRLQLLADAGVLLSNSLEWEATVACVGRRVLQDFADWCAVDYLDEQGALRRLLALHAGEEVVASAKESIPERLWPSVVEEVVRTGEPRLSGSRPRSAAVGGSLMVVPIAARRRTLGALSFMRGPERAEYEEADLALAEELAARVGMAMDSARLLRQARAAEVESRRNAARLSILVEMGLLLAEAGLDLRAVLDVVGKRVSGVIGEGCVIQLLSEEGAWLEAVALHHQQPQARALLAEGVHAKRQRPGEGLHGEVVATGRATLLPEVEAAWLRSTGRLPEYLPYVERFGPQSLLVVPLAVQGRVSGTLGVMRAVAERPYTEEDRKLLESLAERAARAIEDARLYGAATEAVRLRDDFLSVAGHELKTPLSALRLQIQLLARMAREAASTPGLAERAAKADRISERLGALVDELLDVGRISGGRLKLEPEEVDLASLVRDAVGRLWEEMVRAGCEVQLRVEGPVAGRWDKLRLEQVVANLLANAAKYGQGRPVEVGVQAREGEARLWVKDEGIGIAPEDQARIFGRFERVTTGRQYPGLGLGLWITRQIVESHGGRIEVQSEVGKGATFTVVLPCG